MLWTNTNCKNLALNIFSFAGVATLIINSCSYLMWNGFADHGEVCMSSVSWLLYNGYPVYTDLNAPVRYSLEHGPIIYILIGGLMKLFGPSIFSAKLTSILAVIAIMGVSWHWFKNFVNAKTSFWLLGLEAWILLRWYNFYFNRPDSLMVLCAISGMYFATTAKRRISTIMGTAVSLGLLVNLKADGIFPAIPVLVLIYQRLGWKDFLNTFAIMVGIGLLPFMLPNISLPNYIQWLGAATAHGFSFKTFLRTMGILLLYFLGIISWGFYRGSNLFKLYKENMVFIGSIVFSSIVLAVISSKHGSGSNHIAPLIPAIIYILIITGTASRKTALFTKFTSWHKASYVLIVIVCLILFGNAIDGQKRVAKDEASLSMPGEMINDLYLTKTKYKGSTMMVGYGDGDTYPLYRQLVPLMVFDGNPYLFDACALMDMQQAGIKIPDSTIKEIKDGRVKVWLIPKGNSPFTLTNYYDRKLPLFDETFRQTFFSNYELVERTEYFDVWYFTGADNELAINTQVRYLAAKSGPSDR